MDATTTTPIDQTTAKTSNAPLDQLKGAIGNNPLASKATEFAKGRPWATAALAGVVGVALLNTLRGR